MSPKPTKVRWNILILMIVGSAVAYILRTNMSVAGGTMMKDLGFTEIQLGMVFSAFAWGYAVFQFPGGIFGEAFGTRKAMAIVLILWAVLNLLSGMIPGRSIASVAMIVTMLIILRFLVGAVQAPFFPIVGRVIADWFPAGRWGLANGLSNVGITIGGSATAPIIVWLINHYGWRESFYLTTPLALVIAIVWWAYARDYPRDHKGVNEEERTLIDANRHPANKARVKGIWKIALKDRDVLLLTLSYFCMNYVFYIFFSWLFYYLVDVRGFSKDQAAVMNSVFWVVGTVGAIIGGFTCDRLARKYGARWGYRMVPVTGLLLAAILLIAGALSKNVYLALALFSVCFSLTQVTDSSYWAAAISIGDRHASAAACGILNTGGNAVGGIGGLLVPITAKYFGWVAAIATGSVFALAAAILMLFVRADKAIVIKEPAKR